MKLRIHLATGNAHKVAEFAALARLHAEGAHGRVELEVFAADRLPEVVEDTGTFIGNARKKAIALKEVLAPDAWVLADDSGLMVDALDGAPGVESAYYAGPQADWRANLNKLVEAMRDVPATRRQASFYCVLLLIEPGGAERIFEGRCEGRLANVPSGRGGFGYDPIFVPAGHDCTYAELSEEGKNRISHRARAWARLIESVEGRPGT